MSKVISDIQKTKVVFNSVLLCLLISITHYFILFIGGYNKKLTIVEFLIFAVVFFVTTELFIMPNKQNRNRYINFAIYTGMFIITSIPGSIIYSLVKNISSYMVFSESSIIFDCIFSYFIASYLGDSLIKKNEHKNHKILKQDLKCNFHLSTQIYNNQNPLYITQSENLFINNSDLANIIEKNILVDGLSSKANVVKISSDKKKNLLNVIQKWNEENYQDIFILDLDGNLIFTNNNISNAQKQCTFWNVLIKYIVNNVCSNSIESLKNIGFYSQNLKYEVFRSGNYFVIGNKSESFPVQLKNSKKMKLDNIVLELFKTINKGTLDSIEVLAHDELYVLL